MKHLTEEERLTYIEGNSTPETANHLKECADCAAQVQATRRTIQRLEDLEWPARMPRRAATYSPMLRWALAAGIALCTGFGAGRWSGPSAQQIEASVKAEVSRDLQKQLLAAIRDKKKSEIDPTTILTLLGELRDQQSANYISLRKDLETLAQTADARLQFTSRKILELSAANQNFSDQIQ